MYIISGWTQICLVSELVLFFTCQIADLNNSFVPQFLTGVACEAPWGGLFLSPLVSWARSWAQSRAGLPSGERYLDNPMKQWTFWPYRSSPDFIRLPSQCKKSTPVCSVFFCLELYSWKLPVFNFIPKPFIFVWPFVLVWLQRSCLSFIKFSILLAVTIRTLTQPEAQCAVLKQNGSPWKFLNTIIFCNFKDNFAKLGPWQWSQSYTIPLHIVGWFFVYVLTKSETLSHTDRIDEAFTWRGSKRNKTWSRFQENTADTM